MSEERDKRDSHSDDQDASADSTESTDIAANGSGIAASSEDAVGASGTESDDSVSLAKPTGKRSARRGRGAANSSDDTGDEASGGTATKVAVRSGKAAKVRTEKRPNIFKRLRKFFREVITELRKVIWPNRKQMLTYTAVVLVFVTFMVAFISGLDVAFIKGVGWLFG